MRNEEKLTRFRQIVENKYQIYNSLFMSLPYDKMTNIGMLLPFLYEESKDGFPLGKTPTEIIDEFFEKHTEITDEEKRNNLLFIIIQYIERQVVLFDSIEDAAFSSLHSKNENGTIENLYQNAFQQNKLDETLEKLTDFAVRVVFTAHPTQFYSNDVQKILHDLRAAIKDDSVTRVDLLLQQLGKTPFVNHSKPTPYDEALSIIYYLRYVYYDTLGELSQDIKKIFDQNAFNPRLIQLGFWPGGDRDGNPFVTAEITKKVANELRTAILKCYYNHLKYLRRRLTFRGVSELLNELSDLLYQDIFHEKGQLSVEKINHYLDQAKNIINKNHQGLFMNYLDDFSDRVQLFGTHFATLDIRQDSRIHHRILEEIFEKEFNLNYNKISDEEKIKYLTEKSLSINSEDYTDELTKDTIKNVYQLKKIQELNGENGVNRYIISNSETIFDILNVYALFKYCGYQDEEIKFDIVPLFETIKGLDSAKSTMDFLYNLPIYREHLKRRDEKHTIMLGFSDGTKDGGYLKANWEIFRTKEILSAISDENDIKVIFFDGRGGPPARGGGKTHQFYASQGKTIANNEIELTIQGQTITSVFGTKEQATFNFEQLISAGVMNDVFENSNNQLSENERNLIDELANLSYQKYSDLKAHPMFIPYLEYMSTLKYYGRTNIGSRPSKRGKSDDLQFSDLRAIPFVGSWSQLKQNVPGYFGVGTAIKTLKEQGKIEDVKKLYNESAFFKTLILNSMMSMSKSYFPLTFYMKNNPQYGDFWKILYDEFLLSEELMLEISGFKVLMQEDPVGKLSIEMREKIVLPLLTIQQYALQKIQEKTENKEVYEKMVTRSLFGNINASRNSA